MGISLEAFGVNPTIANGFVSILCLANVDQLIILIVEAIYPGRGGKIGYEKATELAVEFLHPPPEEA